MSEGNAAADEGVVITERRGGVLIAHLNRPERMNALGRASFDALSAIWLEFRDDPALRVMILTGAGEQAFCAGIDLRESNEQAQDPAPGPAQPVTRTGTQPQLLASLWTNNLGLYKPVIAAINGWCLAAGFELAMACDLRIVESHARLGLPEVKRGLGAKATTHKLHFLAPLSAGLELAWTGDLLLPERALELGLVSEVVPSGSALDRAIELAEAMAAMPDGYLEGNKERFFQGIGLPLPYALRLEPRERGS